MNPGFFFLKQRSLNQTLDEFFWNLSVISMVGLVLYMKCSMMLFIPAILVLIFIKV